MPDAPHDRSKSASLTPPQPISGAQAFSTRVHGLLDGQPKDEATVTRALEGLDDVFDRIAAKLYRMASMLVGEGEASVRLVETAVANTEFPLRGWHNGAQEQPAGARAAALDLLAQRSPAAWPRRGPGAGISLYRRR